MEADPTGFWVKYDQESALAMSVWETRLKLCAATVVCVATTNLALSDEDTLLQGEWVGFASIRGPMDYDTYYPNPEMGQVVPDDPASELRWHVFDLYTLPAHRQRGLAKKLFVGCVDLAVELSTTLRSQNKRRARLRLFVNSRNIWLVQWYKLMGFTVSGKATPIEGYIVNGISESIPEMTDELRIFWESRIGFAMEKVVELDEGTSGVATVN